MGEVKKERDKAYDFRKIFEQMELDLISSMRRAFYFHQNEQLREGFQFEQWQLVKLRNLENYRRSNKEIVGKYSNAIENTIEETLQESFKSGEASIQKVVNKNNELTLELNLPDETNMPKLDRPTLKIDDKSHREPLKDLDKSVSKKDIGLTEEPLKNFKKQIEILPKAPQEANFFGVNHKKLEALQKSVTEDLTKGQHAVLRKMDDVYRQTIYKAQVNMQAGAKTLNQAIDMATKDFLDKGINCIEYKDGKRVNIASYAEMALRTASHRATLLGEGKKRDEYGLHLVVVSAHANTCKHCEPWQGKVLIDDVFSHPSKDFIEENKQYPLLSEAIEKKLLHPNCRHSLTTYFPGVTRLPVVPDGKKAIELYNAEQLQRYMERQIRKWKREEVGSCDVENKEKAHVKVKEWEKELREHLDKNKQLRRDYNREKVM
nr:phage minor capsid protein [Clostridium algidicarnis]